MIVKISLANLRPGMQIANPGLSQANNPNIYLDELLVEDTAQIEKIRARHFVDVFVDTDAGSYFRDNPVTKAELENPFSSVSSLDTLEADPGNNLDRILTDRAAAERQYQEFLKYSKDFFSGLKVAQEIDMEASSQFVDEVIRQADETGAALLFLSKLQDFDDYTYTHNLNVSILSVLFGRNIGLGRENQMILGLAGLFHDVGKLNLPTRILRKTTKLTKSEQAVFQQHAEHGRDILAKQKNVHQDVVRAAWEHHEHHGGGGYPRGVGSERIGRASALLSVVDAFDTLTSERPSRPALHQHKAISLIYLQKGKAFSPVLVDRFIRFAGIYPVGSVVVLSNGGKAIVTEQNQAHLLKPKVRQILDNKNHYLRKPKDIDLLEAVEGQIPLHIVDCLSPKECRIHVEHYFKDAGK